MPQQRLSLAWGPSFAEFEEGSSWLRTYTAQQAIPQFLKSKIENPGEQVELRISLSVMRRILQTRLGNSVAQVVTQGFEHWVLLRQDPEPGRFDLTPTRREPLANPEHLFSLNERLSQSGEVIEKPKEKDLEALALKLKEKKIERVCVNLLFSHRNPEHQIQVKRFLTEKGFQVFSKARSKDSSDELSAWRRNLLDACLSSFFEKLRSEIQEALPLSKLSYLDTEKGFVEASDVSTTALLFGRERTLQRKVPLLYFGPEDWCWILPEDQNQWRSPWGAIELTLPRVGFFSLQPGTELLLTDEGRVRWGENLGMDPGPMLWGRSSKLTLLDLMGWNWETQPLLRRNEKTEARVAEQVQALAKISRDWKNKTDSQLKKELWGQLSECIFSNLASLNSDEFDVAGVLAPEFLTMLKEKRPKWKWNLLSSDIRETQNFWGASC